MIQIKVKGKRSQEPTEQTPPGVRSGTKILATPDPVSPLPVFIEVQTLAEMSARAVRAGGYEVGGFLIGGLHTHEGKRYVDVRHHIPSLQAESAAAHLTFTNEAQRECYAIKDRDFPGEVVLGWYHTHPGYGVFLSGYDLFIHKQFFTLDWHVAIVIDPTAAPPTRDGGVFIWQDGRISQSKGMTVYAAS